MKKNRSIISEPTIADFYFAVIPMSVCFERDYQQRLYLYFQKNLQILCRFEIPSQQIKKGQIIQFSSPSQLNHFRIQSQKMLDYQWSIYSQRDTPEGQTEQFVEGQKVLVRPLWQTFQNKKQTCQQITTVFHSYKCTFIYNFVVAQSLDHLNMQKKHIFGQKSASLSKIPTLNLNAKRQSDLLNESKIIELGNPQQQKAHTNSQNIYSQKIDESPEFQTRKEQEKGKVKENKQVTSENIPQVSSIQNMSFMPTINFAQQDNQQRMPKISQYQFDQEPSKLGKLSHSDLKIAEQLEQHINLMQKIKQEKQSKKNESSVEENVNLQDFKISEDGEMRSSIDKKDIIKMTSSQLYNDKGEKISSIPYYQTHNFKILIVSFLVCIFIFLVFNRLRSPPNLEQVNGTELNQKIKLKTEKSRKQKGKSKK